MLLLRIGVFKVLLVFVALQVTMSGLHAQTDTISVNSQKDEDGEFKYNYYENPELNGIIRHLETQYMGSDELPSAIDVFLKAVILHEHKSIKIGDNIENLGWTLIDIGNSFYNIQDYLFAEKVFEKALFLFNQSKSELGIITAINNIGLCKLNMDQPEKALIAFRKMLEFSKNVKDNARIYASTIYIGMSLKNAGNYKEAISTLLSLDNASLVLVEGELIQLRNLQLGETYLEIEEEDSALYYFNLVLTDTLTDGNYYNAFALLSIAEMEFNKANINKTISLAENAYSLVTSDQFKSMKANICELLYKSYKTKGNNDKALFYFEEFQSTRNDINKKEIQSFVENYNRKLERIGIKHELNEIKRQKNIANAERMNQQNLAVFLVIMAILLVVSLFSSKNFYSRTNILFNHVQSYTPWQKILLSVSFLIYFTTFYYLFLPLGNALEIKELDIYYRLIPGLISFMLSSVFFVLFNLTQKRTRRAELKENPYTYYIIAALFLASWLLQYTYYLSHNISGINFLLSLALVILASFIVPLYAFILLVENVILRQIDNISKSLNQDISDINMNYMPSEATITIASEKTKGKLTFNVSKLISIEAKGNYCMFNFDEDERLSTEMLHITMKSLEEQLEEYEHIIRCHKSFFANIHKIDKVSGNSRGYFLHLKHCTDSMPVSRGYQKKVMVKIREAKEHISSK